MALSLEIVQELAPDQSSLTAAKKLLKPAKWPSKGQSSASNTIWGLCQGSGANPYYTVADTVDHGYKCTCPSRKFPCKHVLALMWQFSADADSFNEEDPPDWVNDWLGRRRKTSTSTTTTKSSKNSGKNIHLAEEPVKALSPEELAKKQAASAKRAEKLKQATDASLQSALLDFQSWIDDQLRMGIGDFINEVSDRCRHIASRMVDAKATALASRMDEFPAKLMSLAHTQKHHAVFKEFGQLILLTDAWLTNPDDPDARRFVNTTEKRDAVLKNPSTHKDTAVWQNIGEKVLTRKDGLISHATWLIKLNPVDTQNPDKTQKPTFALLLDYYPVSVGRRQVGLGLGACLYGEMAFYPSRAPLRGFLTNYQLLDSTLTNTSNADASPASSDMTQTDTEQKDATETEQTAQKEAQPDNATIKPDTNTLKQHQIINGDNKLWQDHQAFLAKLPWSEQFPYMLTGGRLAKDNKGCYWWQGEYQDVNNSISISIPIKNKDIPPLILGSELNHLFILWDGEYAELLSINSTKWGILTC